MEIRLLSAEVPVYANIIVIISLPLVWCIFNYSFIVQIGSQCKRATQALKEEFPWCRLPWVLKTFMIGFNRRMPILVPVCATLFNIGILIFCLLMVLDCFMVIDTAVESTFNRVYVILMGGAFFVGFPAGVIEWIVFNIDKQYMRKEIFKTKRK